MRVLEGQVDEERFLGRLADQSKHLGNPEPRGVRAVELAGRPGAVEEVVTFCRLVRDIVLRAADVAEVAAKAPARRQRHQLVLAKVPLPHHVGVVAQLLQELGQQRAADIQPGRRAHQQAPVDAGVRHMPPAHDGRAGQAANRLG